MKLSLMPLVRLLFPRPGPSAVSAVFNDSEPAVLDRFRGRDALVQSLQGAILTRGRQVLVYGRTGMGKTSLVWEVLGRCHAPSEYISVSHGWTSSHLLRAVWEKATGRPPQKHTSRERAGFGIPDVPLISATHTTTYVDTVDIMTLVQRIVEHGGIFVIDDADQLDSDGRITLLDLMKKLSDCVGIIRLDRCAIVAIAAVRDVFDWFESNESASERTYPVEVNPMTSPEMRAVSTWGFRRLRIWWDDESLRFIHYHCLGSPRLLNRLCASIAQSVLAEPVAITDVFHFGSVFAYVQSAVKELGGANTIAKGRIGAEDKIAALFGFRSDLVERLLAVAKVAAMIPGPRFTIGDLEAALQCAGLSIDGSEENVEQLKKAGILVPHRAAPAREHARWDFAAHDLRIGLRFAETGANVASYKESPEWKEAWERLDGVSRTLPRLGRG